MHRNRRLVLIDRFIPLLATGVGLVALLAVMAVQLDSGARRTALDADVAAARAAIASATASLATAPAAPVEDDAADAVVAALDERVARLEADLAAARAVLDTASAAAASPVPRPLPADVAVATEGTTAFEDALPMAPATATIDPSLPTTDCIPLGTRFMATPNDSYPVCQSKTVIEVGAITSDSVDVAGAGPIPATGFSTLPGTTCTVMVYSADIAGFAELRVTCS